ncbi:8115_t:CDS:2 [Funneliformis mosseae]|uniref:8115_t:CDS:1 n=1 Tax=Funneliformis mosseae TaxID=27381 RepID=A0A9N9AZM3_FUNMO|nr:8115_t:CDS:2 [Funneliformis mosseae]
MTNISCSGALQPSRFSQLQPPPSGVHSAEISVMKKTKRPNKQR